jgi:pantothenate kinase-related protein Tda10
VAKRQVLHSPLAEAEAFYSFLLAWLEELLDKPRQSGLPIVVGLSAPQGAGKTTLTRRLRELRSERSTTAVSVSIDDFYLTRRHQIELARRHSDNPYLQHRGYRGTHDIDLGTRTLTGLRDIYGHCADYFPTPSSRNAIMRT